MINRIKWIRFFSISKQPQTVPYTPPDLSQLRKEVREKYSDSAAQKFANFESKLKQFICNLPVQAQISKKSPLTYLALFARSCLIANKYVPYQSYYPSIKKIINSDKHELTPFACTALAECFTYFKYEGDEGKIIKRLCDYYAEYYCLFTQSEESAFWEFYMKIMATKTHHNVKFVSLERQRKSTIQFATTKDIMAKIVDTTKINKKIVKNIQCQNNEISFTLVKPTKAGSSKPVEILIRVKGIVNFNQYLQSKEENQIDRDILGQVMEESKKLNTNAAKGWNIIFHGKLEQYADRDAKYRYSQRDDEGQELGYVRSEKVQQQGEISEEHLNSSEKLAELRLSKRYHRGIFYNSTNPNKRLIDTIPTLILSISPKLLQTASVRFYQQNSHLAISHLSSYLTVPQLKEVYGYSKLCQSHWSLYESYQPVRNLLQQLYQNHKESKYNIDILKEIIDEESLDKQEIKKMIASSTQILSEMATNEAKSIGQVNFHGGYDKIWGQINQWKGNYAGDLYWQFRPFFADAVRIMEEVERLAEKASNSKQKHLKIKIVTSRVNLPHLVRHLTEAKYWTVPKLVVKKEEELKAKEILLSEVVKN